MVLASTAAKDRAVLLVRILLVDELSFLRIIAFLS
jgi:hypothetical protein